MVINVYFFYRKQKVTVICCVQVVVIKIRIFEEKPSFLPEQLTRLKKAKGPIAHTPGRANPTTAATEMDLSSA
jgi:hypothetical protein